MKVGIFIDNFLEPQKYKDPGVIACSLRDLGNQVKIYTFNSDSKNFDGLEIKTISKKEGKNSEFWRKEGAEFVIVYSWLSLRFSGLIKSLKSANKKVILKLDSDGYLIYPLKPTYLRSFGRGNSPKQWGVHFLRLIQWNIFGKIISSKRIEQLLLCDKAIIESPLASEKLIYSLKFWGRKQLIKKIVFIPNPINDDITKNDQINKKRNKILMIGRWDDKQKNRIGLIKVLKKCELGNWKLIIIGSGSIKIKNKIGAKNYSIIAFEKIEHNKIFKYLMDGKIFFAPSIHESFNLAAAEALCCGCSLAGTPIESFYYFTKEGEFGSISKNFKITEIKKSLDSEMEKWDKNFYNPDKTAAYWKNELNAKNVCKKINDLLEKI